MNQTLTNDLAGAARAIVAAQEAALLAQILIARGEPANAADAAHNAADKCSSAITRLMAAGVPSEAFDGVPDNNPIRLDALNTPDVRALLDAVRALVPLAERVDQARGRWYPDAPPTDTKGTDLAETLHQLACRLHLEAFGPSGKE